MRADRAGILANLLLVLTVGLLASTAFTLPPDRSAAPVAGTAGAVPADRVVIVDVPGLTWSGIDDSTPALRSLERSGAAGSVVETSSAPGSAADAGQGSVVAQLDVLRRSLERQDACLVEGGRLDEGARPAARKACPVQVLQGSMAARAALDAELADLIATLPPRTLLVVTGSSRPGTNATVHPLLMTATKGLDGLEHLEGTQLGSSATRQSGLVRPADLTATALAVAGVPAPPTLGGAVVSSMASPATDRAATNRDLAMATTLATRIQGPYLWALAIITGAVLMGVAAWGWLSNEVSGAARARLVAAVAGSAVAAVGVCGYASSWLPWWRAGTTPSTDPDTAGLALPLLALVMSTLLVGAGVVGAAWAVWVWWVRHRLAPVAVVMSLTVVVMASDVLRGSPWGLRAVFGLQPLATGRFYGLSTLTFGFLASATVILAACLASMLVRPRRPRALPVIAVIAVGLAVTSVVGWPDAGADLGGVPALVVATFLLATATAGRRLAASSVFLCLLIGGAVMGVVMVADWMRPAAERTTAGRLLQRGLDGQAWEALTTRVGGAVEVVTSTPAAWTVLALATLWSIAVLSRSSMLHASLRPLWDYSLMHAGATALLALWLIGAVVNRPGLPVVATGLTLMAGVVLCVVARGRARVSAESPAG
ncbi:MAG: hypothetical protein WA892_06345 [Ornithinimicrobium sp.]